MNPIFHIGNAPASNTMKALTLEEQLQGRIDTYRQDGERLERFARELEPLLALLPSMTEEQRQAISLLLFISGHYN